MEAIGILGAGSWGTALAAHLAANGRRVVLWSRRDSVADELRRERENRVYLPGIPLPPELTVTSRLEAIVCCEPILVVVPSHGFRSIVRSLLDVVPEGRQVTIVSATKGIEEDSLQRMSAVAVEEADRRRHRLRFAVLSGPTFAVELAKGMPSAAVVAAESGSLATELRELLATPTLRLYSSRDVVGVELGGAAKNVVAVGAGVLHGLGLGHNTMAALITRGLHEMTRLCLSCGGESRTLSGLAGLGDLVLTCTGGLSRNRQTGVELARGKTLAEIESERSMVAEGVKNSLALGRLADRLGIEMPITQQMRSILYEGKPPRQALEELMAREQKSETAL